MSKRLYKIKPNKKSGKYLDYFDTQQEASDHIHDLIRTYRYHPKNISLYQIVREQREKYGININQNSFYRWVEEEGITPKHKLGKHTKLKRKTRSYTLSPEVVEELSNYHNRSYLVDLSVRVLLGMYCRDVVVFLDDGIRVFFIEDTGHITAVTNRKLNERDKKLIRTWVQEANVHGIKHIVNECKRIGFQYYGATYDS